MKIITRLLTFTNPQNLAIAALLLLAIILQLIIMIPESVPPPQSDEERQWLALSQKVDSARAAVPVKVFRKYPFNPNFISDEKGYRLGMSVSQIDRLHKFRSSGRFVNSAAEFQKVTGISDSLLMAMEPQFKFPEWVKRKNQDKKRVTAAPPRSDINKASPEELISVFGIGPALSERILEQREKLGAFVSMEQMEHIWGISPEVATKLKERFFVAEEPSVKKININSATMKELGQFPYFRYPLSRHVVTFRSMNGAVTRENLALIHNFPVDRLDIIAVYLEF